MVEEKPAADGEGESPPGGWRGEGDGGVGGEGAGEGRGGGEV